MADSPFADLTAVQYDLLLAVAHEDHPTTMDVIRAYRTAREASSHPNAALDQLIDRDYVTVRGDRTDDYSLGLSKKGRNALWTFREELDAALEASST
jgi:DNA-binding MarR family transcriptional regulator